MRFSILLSVLALTACTQDFTVFQGDAGTSGDATTNDSSSDAMTDSGTDSAPASDGGLSFTCNGNPVTDCSQCNGATQPCVYCAQQGPQMTGRCVQQGSSCFQGAPNGYQLCQCQQSSTCPEAYEVCRNQTCRTCSDSQNNVGLTCQNGTKCTDAGTCQ